MPELSTILGTTAFTAVSGGSSRTLNDRIDDVVDPRDYGLIADGSAHALSTVYGSLGAAQAVYPFVTSLTQQIDWAACKQASNVAFGADGSEHGSTFTSNKRLRLPAGSYWFGDETWTIRNLGSGIIEGDGKLVTTIKGNATLLAFDGIWYTKISGLSLQCQTSTATAAMELDGNIPGHAYTTRGVQGVTLQDMLIDGGNSDYVLAMCRQGGGGAQGSECTFINVHLSQADFALYYQNGFNALANTFIGGNFQSYSKHGIYVVGGTIAVINSGFQSTAGYLQLENDGWDIRVGDSGAYESCVFLGCRTESLRFLKNAGAVRTAVIGCVGNSAMQNWSATTAFGPVAPSYKAILEQATDGLFHLYEATTPGTTGGSIPTFPVTGTVSDGSVVWTEIPFYVIDIPETVGSVDLATTHFTGGWVSVPVDPVVTVDDDYTATVYDKVIIVDATAGPVTIDLSNTTTLRGQPFTVKKADTSANAVTISNTVGFESGGTTVTLAGGARSSKTYLYADQSPGGTRKMILVGSS